MAWKETLTYKQISKRSYPALNTESKTVETPTEAEVPHIINGVQNGTINIMTTVAVEFIRTITTTTAVEVYESTGFMSEESAKAQVESKGWEDVAAGVKKITEMDAVRAGGANGWKVTKTITEVTTKIGPWLEN